MLSFQGWGQSFTFSSNKVSDVICEGENTALITVTKTSGGDLFFFCEVKDDLGNWVQKDLTRYTFTSLTLSFSTGPDNTTTR